jgi:L-alanine-DL-glutamate epimerase-like enolase superfamily enzyme
VEDRDANVPHKRGALGMKINHIDAIPIRAPRKEAVRAAAGVNPVAASGFGIIRIATDDGYEGVGETSITSLHNT